MNRFENYTIIAINKITSGNKRPDTEKIFETITKKSALNISLDDALQKLREMQSSSKLRNTSYQDLN